jgi:hypothetical protein
MAYPKIKEEVWDEFLERLTNGSTITAIVKDKSMPSWTSISRKLAADPDFERQYRLALEFRGMLLQEELEDIKRDAKMGMGDPQGLRLAADITKWQVARMTPKIYGDRQQLEVTPSKGGSYLEALTQANAAEPVVITDERDTQPKELRARDGDGGQPKSG